MGIEEACVKPADRRANEEDIIKYIVVMWL